MKAICIDTMSKVLNTGLEELTLAPLHSDAMLSESLQNILQCLHILLLSLPTDHDVVYITDDMIHAL